MVCEKVAKLTQMRHMHDKLVNAFCLVISACSCQSAEERLYRALADTRRAWLNANAGAKSWRCGRGSSLPQWMSWLRMRLRSRTLLRLLRKLGRLRRGLNGPSRPRSGRMC